MNKDMDKFLIDLDKEFYPLRTEKAEYHGEFIGLTIIACSGKISIESTITDKLLEYLLISKANLKETIEMVKNQLHNGMMKGLMAERGNENER